PSTIRLWRSLDEVQGLQVAKHDHLTEYVLAAFEHMYRRFEQDVRDLPDSQICHVHYEKLVEDPLEQLSQIYEQLELGRFADVQRRLSAAVQEKRNYRTNRYVITDEQKQLVTQRWSQYLQRFGYEPACCAG